MLKHTIQVNIEQNKFKQCIYNLKEPSILFGKTENLGEVRALGDNLYNVIFKWKKFGRTWIFDTTIIVLINSNYVKYISTADSRYKCKFEIKQIDDKIVTLECEFNVGIIRNLIIKAAMNKDFKIFVESIARTIAEICNNQYSNNINNGKMAPSNEMLSCANCIFYEKSKNQCSILSKTIYDHNNPLCGGKYYIEIIR